MDCEKITFVEYQEKKKRVMDSLGRKYRTCSGVNCDNCPLGYYNNGFEVGCPELEQENPLEAIKIIMDYEIPIDWNEVKKDDPILVSDDGFNWCKRYFAEYRNGVYAWNEGATSWSAKTKQSKTSWKYVKLTDKEGKND